MCVLNAEATTEQSADLFNIKNLKSLSEVTEVAEKVAEKACEFVKGNVYHRRDVGTAELVNKRIEHMKEILN